MILNFNYLPYKFKYDYIYTFYENKAIVKLNDKYGFIDKLGNEIVECKHDWVWYFRESAAIIKLNNKYGL